MAALTLLLLCGGVIHSDFTRRRIPNAYCVAIAGVAVLWWLGGGGLPGLLALAKHLIVPLIVAIPLLVLFALRIFAGGDVKLLLALVLWVPSEGIVAMLMVTILGGGILAVALKLLNRVFRGVNADTVPYGVPIVAGALLILLPQFRYVMGVSPIAS